MSIGVQISAPIWKCSDPFVILVIDKLRQRIMRQVGGNIGSCGKLRETEDAMACWLATNGWALNSVSNPVSENNGGRHSWPTSSFQMFTHPPHTQTHAEYAYYTYPFTLTEIKFEKRNLWFRAWGFRLVMPMLAVQPLVDPNLPRLCFPHLEIGYFSCYKCAES